MIPTPPLTAAELAELEAQSERFSQLRLLSIIPAATIPEWEQLEYQLAIAVPALLAALRNRLRWRTVSADGLPKPGEHIVLRDGLYGPYSSFLNDRGCWDHPTSLGQIVAPTDRWLHIPEAEQP